MPGCSYQRSSSLEPGAARSCPSRSTSSSAVATSSASASPSDANQSANSSVVRICSMFGACTKMHMLSTALPSARRDADERPDDVGQEGAVEEQRQWPHE